MNFTGDHGPAVNAIMQPYTITTDANNNIYFTDKESVRRIDATTGIITTIAGTGKNGFSGDGGPATAALLSIEQGFYVNMDANDIITTSTNVAFDTAGNIYFADNSRIRRIDIVSGIINTIAGNGNYRISGDGGPATAAGMSPSAVAIDNNDNIYISDANGIIRKIDPSTGIISTIDSIYANSIVADKYGDLYLSVSSENRIMKLSIATNDLTVVAGNGYGSYLGGFLEGYGGYSGDGGPARGGELFIPTGLSCDNAGNVFFADTYNNRIRRVDASTGIITTVAGNGYEASIFQGIVCADALISAPYGGFSGDGGSPLAAELFGPTGVCVDQ